MISMLEGSEQEGHYSRFCRRIISLDRSIAYAGLADKFGSLISSASRSPPFADEKDAEQYSMQTTLSTLILEHYESKAGKIWYSIAAHEKVLRITVPIAMGDHRFFILLMMDAGSDAMSALGEKILPFVSCSDLCERLLALDCSIAYAGLADKFGSLVTAAFRETPLAGDKDAEQYSMQSAVSALVTEHFEDNAGKARYQVTFYEKKARAVVPLVLAGRTYVLTMVGDLDPDLATIMADKVMPFLSSRQSA